MANINKRAFYVNGELLRKVIELKGLTQTDVYKSINIGENTIYRVIKYDRMESSEDFDKMCKFLDISPILLLSKSYIHNSEDSKQEILINQDNLHIFIDQLGYENNYDKLFDKSYIHDFFKGALSSDRLNEEIEQYLFNKIVECRNIFVEMYTINNIKSKSKSKTNIGNDEEFYKEFESWFKKNILNNKKKILK